MKTLLAWLTVIIAAPFALYILWAWCYLIAFILEDLWEALRREFVNLFWAGLIGFVFGTLLAIGAILGERPL